MKRTGLVKIGFVVALILIVAFGSFQWGAFVTSTASERKGYEKALSDVQELLAENNIEFVWEELGEGQYNIQIWASTGGLLFEVESRFDCFVWHYDSEGNLISYSHHPMTTVNQGKDWVEQQLFNPSNTEKALYIGTSNDETAVSTAWTALPNEITDSGLARALGAYVSTGVGASNVSKTFSITATVSCCLYGLHYDSGTSTTLVCAEQQGSGSRKNMNSGDTLAITIQWALS